MPDTTTVICPKCRGRMRTYERNGVLVDQCDECRGIFLDRGELEQLLNAQRGHERRDVDDERHHDRHDHDRDHDHEHDSTTTTTERAEGAGAPARPLSFRISWAAANRERSAPT